MSRADYAHWNEDADYMWWHEEGKHVEEPPEPDDDDWRPDYDQYEIDDDVEHNAPGRCVDDGNFNYRGEIGAPGYGQSWECATCGHPFVKIGDKFHDARVNVFELHPEDVR